MHFKSVAQRIQSCWPVLVAGLFATASSQAADFQDISTLQSPGIQSFNDVPKVMVIQDLSGSMWGTIDGEFKYEIAKRALSETIREVGTEVDLGLIAYGHRSKENCNDIQVAAIPGVSSTDQISQFLQSATPLGKTPLASSLRVAGELIAQEDGTRSVVLFTDGLETCGGDPCQVVRDLRSQGMAVRVDVIGFDLNNEKQRELQCIADESGGVLLEASDETGLKDALSKLVEEASNRNDALTTLHASIEALKDRVVDLEAELFRTGEERDELLAIIERLRRDLATAREETSSLNESLAAVRENIAQKDIRIAELEALLAGNQQDLAALELRNKNLMAENASLAAENDDLTAGLAAAKQTAAGQSDEVARLTNELAKIQAAFIDSERRADSLASANSMLHDELENAQLASGALAKENGDLRDLLSNKQIDLDLAAQTEGRLRDRLDGMQADLAKTRAASAKDLDRLQNKLILANAALDDLTDERDSLLDSLADATLRQDRSDRTQAVAEQRLTDALGEADKLKADARDARMEMASLRDALADRNQQNTALGDALNRARGENLALIDARDDLQNRFNDQSVELVALRDRFSRFFGGLEEAVALSKTLGTTLNDNQTQTTKVNCVDGSSQIVLSDGEVVLLGDCR